eukprot:CAMPEP_0118937714 /NCGR_PEP_ID=MMETSP1169-20130426/23569_1 /TAXON_ID=36882 /ORGANISM="Pyramimonas obovata, Strain CCMP722" /LENGTH=511 /DNA_ID=CAMNT_0006881433 /DNA_START=409 /DNA_END=1944 /DNA_ORIENTATION=+
MTNPGILAQSPTTGGASPQDQCRSLESIVGSQTATQTPFGNGSMEPTNLHYMGCGCPLDANLRLYAHILDGLWLHKIHEQIALRNAPTTGSPYHASPQTQGTLEASRNPQNVRLDQLQQQTHKRPLCIAYVLPHHHVTGGMKVICEHLRLLSQRGHYVVAIYWGDGERAIPPWSDVRVSQEVVLRVNQTLSDGLCNIAPMKPDVVIMGWFTQITSVLGQAPCPVMYFEQGHEFVFGDPIRFCQQHGLMHSDRMFHSSMHLPIGLCVVSEATEKILNRQFGRMAFQVPNGVDSIKFVPGKRCPSLGIAPTQKSVLIVGNPTLPLKGFDVALSVLQVARSLVPFEVVWILQKMPAEPLLSAAKQLNVHFVLDPKQEDLPRYYRGHAAFLFTSRYEGFGMPVLEAMACGLPVVCSLTVSAFAKHGVNALVAPPLEAAALGHHLLALLGGDGRLARALAANARATAEAFSWGHAVDRLELALASLAHAAPLMEQTGYFAPSTLQSLAALAHIGQW